MSELEGKKVFLIFGQETYKPEVFLAVIESKDNCEKFIDLQRANYPHVNYRYQEETII